MIRHACILIALAVAPAAVAQRTITIQNLAPHERDEWITVSVPFEAGAVAETPELHVEGSPTVWQPFGARWPDGSVRQALCMFRRRLDALSEQYVPLTAGAGPALETAEFGLGRHELAVVVRQGDDTTRAVLTPVALLEENPARKVVLLRARVGTTGLVGEMTIELFAGQPHAYCSIAAFFSDPTTADLDREFDEIAIDTKGLVIALRHAEAFGITGEQTEHGSRVSILRDAVLGDGQGVRRSGALLPSHETDDSVAESTLRAAAVCRPLAATTWTDTGAFGPFGHVPEIPPWLRGARLRPAFAARHARFVAESRLRPDPFRLGKHQPAKAPGQTGDQPDFGVVQLEPVAATSIPSFLYEVELSILQEACRPVHFFEQDGSPVLPANHPDWVVWEGRTHYDPASSPDRLGKPDAVTPKFRTNGWRGKKRSHWSSNYLCAYYLLTGDPAARLEIENEVRLYLAGQTVDPDIVTSGTGQARAVGRTLHTAAWLWLCTGDDALRERMIARIHDVAMPRWFGRERADGELRPFGLNGKDGRVFGGAYPFWPAWMDTLAVIGPAAVHAVTGDELAKEFADGLALNTLRHAWRIAASGQVRIVYALRWADDGRVPTEAERWDPEFTHTSSSIAVWGIPSLAWARRAAAERGLDDLVARADDLLARLRAARRPPGDAWFDRFGQWDAIPADVQRDGNESTSR